MLFVNPYPVAWEIGATSNLGKVVIQRYSQGCGTYFLVQRPTTLQVLTHYGRWDYDERRSLPVGKVPQPWLDTRSWRTFWDAFRACQSLISEFRTDSGTATAVIADLQSAEV